MCGICGIAGFMAKEDREQLVPRMNRAIRHRGPDETGYLSSDFATLAMSRLSIIDLEGGQQPIYNEERTKCVFFNGEIYNFQELRADLEEEGHRFATRSDTEVLVHLYEEYGRSMPERLRGMFAFCIYDIPERTLFFARDPFGEKPFFYHLDDRTLTFSSEIDSLLQNPAIPRVLNQDVLHYYLCVSYVPEPFTLLKDVYSLQPGHSLTFRNGAIETERYFRPDYHKDDAVQTEEDACDYLRPILQKAISRQTISDVPLGAFLSGGTDSSTIAAFLQKSSDRKIKTFTVRFEDASFDESPIAREVAEYLGTDHHEITIPNADFSEEIFWLIIDHVGFPFVDSSAIPTYYITKEIRNHVTVALSGDGGDELFAGYPIFQWWQRIRAIQKYPAIMREAALSGTNLLGHLPGLSRNSRLRQLSRALTVSRYRENDFGLRIHTMFDERELARIVSRRKAAVGSSFDLLSQFPEKGERWSSLRKAMYFRLIHDLPLDMLVKVDRMSMANSLEVRAPFLDADLFAASARIPDRMLMNNGRGKRIIRRLMREELPKSVFEHPKTGFSIPLHHYQNSEFRRLAGALIDPASPVMELFDPAEIAELKRSGLDNKSDNARVSVYRTTHRLWQMMMLFGWAKRFDVTIDVPREKAAASAASLH
jgi:asparagine synthase (glutamine-hydrolysing)